MERRGTSSKPHEQSTRQWAGLLDIDMTTGPLYSVMNGMLLWYTVSKWVFFSIFRPVFEANFCCLYSIICLFLKDTC